MPHTPQGAPDEPTTQMALFHRLPQGEAALAARGEGPALERDELADAALGQAEELIEAVASERHLLGGTLYLHEGAGPGHDHVHVDLGRGVLRVVEVEGRLALHDAHADGRHAVAQRGRRLHARHAPDGVGQGHEAAGDGGGARPAIGLDHVAVDPHGALAELAAVHHRAQRASHQTLDLLRAPAGAAGLALRARVGRARQHGVLGGDPPEALTLEEGRDLVLRRGRADHLGGAEFHQHGAFGVREVVAREGDRAELIRGAPVRASVHGWRAAAREGRRSRSCLYPAIPAKMACAISSR